MQTSTANDGQRPGKASAFYKNILQRILNANFNDVTAAIDENGEPKFAQEGVAP